MIMYPNTTIKLFYHLKAIKSSYFFTACLTVLSSVSDLCLKSNWQKHLYLGTSCLDSLFLFNSKYCNRSISVFVISKNYKPLEILPCLVLRNRRWNRFALKEALKLLYIISTNTRTFCFSIHSLFILFSYQWSIKWATTNLQSLITSKRTNFRILSNKHNVFVNCELFSRQH